MNSEGDTTFAAVSSDSNNMSSIRKEPNGTSTTSTITGAVSSPPRRYFGASPTFDEEEDGGVSGTTNGCSSNVIPPPPPPMDEEDEDRCMLSPCTPVRPPPHGYASNKGTTMMPHVLANPHSAAYALTPTIRNTHSNANTMCFGGGAQEQQRCGAPMTHHNQSNGAFKAVVSPDDHQQTFLSDLPREIGFSDDEELHPFDMSKLSVLGEGDVFGESKEGTEQDPPLVRRHRKPNGGSTSLNFRPTTSMLSYTKSDSYVVNRDASPFNKENMVSSTNQPNAISLYPLQVGAVRASNDHNKSDDMLDSDDDDTIEDSDFNDFHAVEEDGEDHIAKIVFPNHQEEDGKNLSFRSLDEGKFRKWARSSAASSRQSFGSRNGVAASLPMKATSRRSFMNSSPLTVGSLERHPSIKWGRRGSRIRSSSPYALYQPTRNDSLTDFGMRDAALAAAAIFQDDQSIDSRSYTGNINLYQPFAVKRGNSTGSCYSIPSLHMGKPLPSAWDDGSVSTYMNSITGVGGGADHATWLETLGEGAGCGGSFDEEEDDSYHAHGVGFDNGTRFSFAFGPGVVHPLVHQQNASEWLDELKNKNDEAGGVTEAASSKFLRAPPPEKQQQKLQAVLPRAAGAGAAIASHQRASSIGISNMVISPNKSCQKPPLYQAKSLTVEHAAMNM